MDRDMRILPNPIPNFTVNEHGLFQVARCISERVSKIPVIARHLKRHD